MSDNEITLVRKTNVDQPDQPWVPSTKFKHVWHHTPTGKWTFSDETSAFDTVMVDTEEQAHQRMMDYVTFDLDRGITDVERLLEKTPTLDKTISEPALELLAKCQGEQAIVFLRRHLDALREHNEELHDLVVNRPKTNIG